MKPHTLGQTAEHDIERAFAHYLSEGGPDMGLGFMDAIDAALCHIEHHPGTGSPRYGELCEVPGLRLWLVTRFPYAVVYVEGDTHIVVIRVLHQHTDIPARVADML